jgi:hypothetical protein
VVCGAARDVDAGSGCLSVKSTGLSYQAVAWLPGNIVSEIENTPTTESKSASFATVPQPSCHSHRQIARIA